MRGLEGRGGEDRRGEEGGGGEKKGMSLVMEGRKTEE